MIKTYKMRRRSLVGPRIREFGEPVPEAHLWRTVESSLRSRRIDETEMSEADFAAAVERFCPAEADAIYAKVGVARPNVQRAHRAAPVVVTAPVPVAGDVPAAPRRRGRPPKARAV